MEAKAIYKSYRGDGQATAALEDVSFTAAPGEFWAIMGPSGAGKSTLLKILGDLLTPTAGDVSVFGLTAAAARARQYFSYVFQNPVLLPWRNVRENVQLPPEVLRRPGRAVDELLALMGLQDFGGAYPHQLSGGMQQRVAIARALTFDPRVLLLDEPFGALDEMTRDNMNLELLRVWAQVRINVFVVTHSLSEAVFLADKVLVLSRRPARVLDVLKIPFARPREIGLRDTVEFRSIVRCLREKLN